MADPTPPSDIPEPASPTPATPAPQAGPAGGPKRIRSMPDRPANARPVGTIRSVPTTSRVSARPPGTYAASFGTERSWSRGLGILWSLFLLTMLAEACNAAFYLLAGKISWPPQSSLMLGGTALVLPLETGRLLLVCTLFVGLWTGWGWLRYVLATVDFLAGALLLMRIIASYHATPKFKATGIADAPIYTPIESTPLTALGILYLGTAAYLVFSIDVQEFMTHRRTNGRIWSALLVTVVSYACMLLILGAQPIYNTWLHTQRAGALAFGEDTLRTMSSQWAGDSIDSRIDPEFGKQFTPDGRKATFANFKDLGQLRDANPAPPMVRVSVESDPLQNIVPAPTDIATTTTKDGYGFQLISRYNTTGADFEHGKVKFGFDLVRDFFGPWRVRGLDAVPINIDRPHRPTPASSPDPSAVPGTPDAVTPGASPALVPSPTPTSTTSTQATDAAAPTPAASVPTLSPPQTGPLPAAPANPGATPVPSTGG